MHPEFLIDMLKACGEKGLHRAVDTCGFAPVETMLEVAKHTDLFLYDLKMLDASLHKKWTGKNNHLILDNLKALAAAGANINIRIPFIGNVNTHEDEVRAMADFVASLTGKKPEVNLLPYHNIAQNKYNKLGQVYNSEEMREPTDEEIGFAKRMFSERGMKVEIGG